MGFHNVGADDEFIHNNNVDKDVKLVDDKLVIIRIFTTIGTKCAC